MGDDADYYDEYDLGQRSSYPTLRPGNYEKMKTFESRPRYEIHYEMEHGQMDKEENVFEDLYQAIAMCEYIWNLFAVIEVSVHDTLTNKTVYRRDKVDSTIVVGKTVWRDRF